ncbi:MAG: DUF3800 domain-containing protein [Leptospiraceae bacterium]|nr:DUF3800 domain-containing protein [Leptospiraceae bacterium]
MLLMLKEGFFLDQSKLHSDHRFLDEAGDTSFFGKGKIPIIGKEGVSLSFILGMVRFNSELEPIRKQINLLQKTIEEDSYFQVSSIKKRIAKGGFYFHATDDIPEVRKVFFDFIKSIDCSFEAIVARKDLSIFARKHNTKEEEFYADLLSHLLKNKLELSGKLVLNIAQRGKSTKNNNLELALKKAESRFLKNAGHSEKFVSTKVVFNVQNQMKEPLLNIADYFCWAVQRVFEKGETRYYDYLIDKISLVIDLYDSKKYKGNGNYYTKENPLGADNKISPLLY